MAWRPQDYLIAGTLDNTEPHMVTGLMYIIGLPQPVSFDLDGDFHRDIRGASIEFQGYATPETDHRKAAEYMKSFSLRQTGKVGDVTAGLRPFDYGDSPYVEWYSDQNGRVVLEIEPKQMRVIGTPIPYIESDPISREQQAQNMADHMGRIIDGLRQKRSQDKKKPNGSDDTPPEKS